MKNQYFGDIYDYTKYGLIRMLASNGKISVVVCWMLTPNDGKRDGHHVDYLQEAKKWRALDPQVFDFLRTAVLDRCERNVRAVEESDLFPNTSFYSHRLTDDSGRRQQYFNKLFEFSSGAELVFFDPDNGLEVKSITYGKGGSSKYLYMHEVAQTFHAGHSLLIYQHLPPLPREPFVRRLAVSLRHETGSDLVYSFLTTRIAFLLIPQAQQVAHFAEVASRMQAIWGSLMDIQQHSG